MVLRMLARLSVKRVMVLWVVRALENGRESVERVCIVRVSGMVGRVGLGGVFSFVAWTRAA